MPPQGRGGPARPSALQIAFVTTPSRAKPCQPWKATTACHVFSSKVPRGAPAARYLRRTSVCCSVRTRAPRLPYWSGAGARTRTARLSASCGATTALMQPPGATGSPHSLAVTSCAGSVAVARNVVRVRIGRLARNLPWAPVVTSPLDRRGQAFGPANSRTRWPATAWPPELREPRSATATARGSYDAARSSRTGCGRIERLSTDAAGSGTPSAENGVNTPRHTCLAGAAGAAKRPSSTSRSATRRIAGASLGHRCKR